MNRKLTYVLLLFTVVALIGVPQVSANQDFMNAFNATYSSAVGSRIDNCALCHINGVPGGTRNPYGMDFENVTGHRSNPGPALVSIEGIDSDKDGFKNIDEIHNFTYPGNPTDFPPKITSFSPATPLSDTAPATETFSIVVNQVVDTVTWFLDGSVQKTDNSVSASNFAVTTSVPILHNVTAVAQRTGDGSAMQKWDWTVTGPTTGSIAGMKFNDTNNNGVKDTGEPGLANWQINLKKPDGTTVNMMTDASGNYNFTNLAAGTYTVSETLQQGWTQTFPAAPGTYSVPLAAGQNVVNKDFGNFKPVPTELGSISGDVINVATGMGIPNVNIRLVAIVGKGTGTKSIRMETTTDSTGMWEFDNLPAGRYIITEQLPKGFIPVTPPVMNIMLAQGQNSMNNDFKVKPIKALMPPMQAQGS